MHTLRLIGARLMRPGALPSPRRGLRAAVLASLGLVAALPCAAQQSWLFEASLDGKPIGEHRFVLDRSPDGSQLLRSEAMFDVRLLGIALYRYRHQAQERWNNGCLQSIQADTDDNGERTKVSAASGAGLPAGCAMSFAYWNPAILKGTQLLNAQTGRVEPVQIQSLADASLDVQGKPVTAKRWRIAALKQRIDVWYDGDGRWV
ncbi:MAG: hypothetical protein EOO29_17390, partial [Comamonadaceae bacterium]